MDCQICCEKFNKSTHFKVICGYCDYSNCRSCFQKYLVDTSLDPHCMNCKKFFSHEFLSDNCTLTFISKTLKEHRENILFDREKALLPNTQNDVLIEKEQRLIRIQLNKINNERKNLKYIITDPKKLREEKKKLNNEYRVLYNKLYVHEAPREVKKFIRKCPVVECRGFLSTQWKCGSCETNICNKCNEPKLQEHTCDPENVASMELLNKDTKPCPNCGTMIFKIDGCDMMFCVDCHTAWSWKLGTIENGVIHNPHYYDFLRKKNNGFIPRNPGDNQCAQRLPGYHLLLQHFVINSIVLPKKIDFEIKNIHRLIAHINVVELRRYNYNHTNDTFKKERVLYLLNELSEKDFKKILQQREKRNNKYKEFSQVYQMFIDVGTDTLVKIYEAFSIEEIIIHSRVFEPLIKYFNESLGAIGKRYKCVSPGISYDLYQFSQNYKGVLSD